MRRFLLAAATAALLAAFHTRLVARYRRIQDLQESNQRVMREIANRERATTVDSPRGKALAGDNIRHLPQPTSEPIFRLPDPLPQR